MKKIARGESLGVQAYSIIKQAIISGDLSPGDWLHEEKVATNLGISRTPLREALQLLSTEGLVILEKGKPAIVASFTYEEALELLEVRSILETSNLDMLASNIDAEWINQLENHIRLQEATMENQDYQAFNDLDHEFHLLLADKSRNKTLANLIVQLNSQVSRAFIILSKTLPFSVQGAIEEHTSIVNALKNKDIQTAKVRMENHLKNVGKRI
ncbi:GntR family transcriptional regulator [Cytobacillus purgationiresistens]|uniref:DNA-binding GntR family transcriptional regulator n=1 Tax=Cytobacillus purgationiresistens TaxID=863449 RepID=A0ABU0ARS2_9BACI|nr:GntR family transcriptional regulator [Cytobacillus purgationiresistens]MDQ0273471.1 DNA-binding GntR family transcriptional regulator [Cytobacillus purgationiresistens]